MRALFSGVHGDPLSVAIVRRPGRLVYVGAVAITALLPACRSPFTPGGVAGTYTLITVDGSPLPFTATNGGVTITVAAGSVRLMAAQTYTMTTTLTLSGETGPTTFTPAETGTFALAEPSTIRLQSEGGLTTIGSVDGNRLTLSGEGGFTYLYER